MSWPDWCSSLLCTFDSIDTVVLRHYLWNIHGLLFKKWQEPKPVSQISRLEDGSHEALGVQHTVDGFCFKRILRHSFTSEMEEKGEHKLSDSTSSRSAEAKPFAFTFPFFPLYLSIRVLFFLFSFPLHVPRLVARWRLDFYQRRLWCCPQLPWLVIGEFFQMMKLVKWLSFSYKRNRARRRWLIWLTRSTSRSCR